MDLQSQVESLKDQIKWATDDGRYAEIPALSERIAALSRVEDEFDDGADTKGTTYASKRRAEDSPRAATRTPPPAAPWSVSLTPSSPTPLPPETPRTPQGASVAFRPQTAALRRRPHTAGLSGAARTPRPFASGPPAPTSPTSPRPNTAPHERPNAGRHAASSSTAGAVAAGGGAGAVRALSSARGHQGEAVGSRAAAASSAAVTARPASAVHRQRYPPWPLREPVEPARPAGARQDIPKQPQRVPLSSKVTPRVAVTNFARQDHLATNVWQPETWLELHHMALRSGRADQLVALRQAVRASTDEAVQRRAYKIASLEEYRPGASVDMSTCMRASADVAFCRRDSLSPLSPPPMVGKRTPRMQIDTESPLDVALALRDGGSSGSVILVAEVNDFACDGSINERSLQAVWPGDLLLRSDFGRFVGHLNDVCSTLRSTHSTTHSADAAATQQDPKGAPARGEMNLRSEMAALREPLILACRRVTIFRGPAEQGYPFLLEPMHVTVLLTALPTTDPHVSYVNHPSQPGQTEWYASNEERDAVVDRIDLLAELARREGAAFEKQDDVAAPPLLLMGAPGCGAPRQQPRDALAYALKACRHRYAGCFGSMHLCCRSFREPLEELAALMRAVVNDEETKDWLRKTVEPYSLQAAVCDAMPSTGSAASAAEAVDNVRASLQRRAERRQSARAAREADEAVKRDPAATLRKIRQADLLVPVSRPSTAGGCQRSLRDRELTKKRSRSLNDLGNVDAEPGAPAAQHWGEEQRRGSCPALMDYAPPAAASEALRAAQDEPAEPLRGSRQAAPAAQQKDAVRDRPRSSRAARESIQRKAEVFKQMRSGSDRSTRKEHHQNRKVSSLRDALQSDEQTTLGRHLNVGIWDPSLNVTGPLRPGIDHSGTKREDARGIYGDANALDWEPSCWGDADDRRRVIFESGRTGEYERLRDMHRRRLREPRVGPPADVPARGPGPLHVQAPGLAGEAEREPQGSGQSSDRSKPSAADAGTATLRLVHHAPAGRLSRELLRQHTQVGVVSRKLEDEADSHRAADRDALQLEGALLRLAMEVGGKLEARRRLIAR